MGLTDGRGLTLRQTLRGRRMGCCCWDAEGLEAGSLDGWTVSKSTERKYGQVMDGMKEVRKRNFRGSRMNGLGGAGKTSSCQQRAKVGGGLLRSSRPDAPRSQCEEELVLWVLAAQDLP